MVFEDVDPSTGYHFCPRWHCVPSLILGWGAQIVSAKIQMRKYPATREANHLLLDFAPPLLASGP